MRAALRIAGRHLIKIIDQLLGLAKPLPRALAPTDS
jgi:hypothetical protein